MPNAAIVVGEAAARTLVSEPIDVVLDALDDGFITFPSGTKLDDIVFAKLEEYFIKFEAMVFGDYCTSLNEAGGLADDSGPYKRFISLPPELASAILQSDKLQISSENCVWTAVKMYHAENPTISAADASRLHMVPRYHLMGPSFVRDIVLSDPYIKSDIKLFVRIVVGGTLV
jgi:hypothetical protein